jgi:hypothetical protein
MKKRITFVGLDTHKNSIEVALADDGSHDVPCPILCATSLIMIVFLIKIG